MNSWAVLIAGDSDILEISVTNSLLRRLFQKARKTNDFHYFANKFGGR